PLPLIPDNRGRRVIPFTHFINNDLEYLWGGASSQKYTTSMTKTKAADYGHIKWIKDLVPRTMWIQEPLNYDKHALWGVSHWGRKHHQLGVESYQKRLNLTKPDTYRSDLKRREAYTTYSNPRGFIYQNKDKKNRTAPIAKSLASHISSKCISQSRSIKMGASERACRSSGSGGEGSRNGGQGRVESGRKNGLNSNNNLNVGKKGNPGRWDIRNMQRTWLLGHHKYRASRSLLRLYRRFATRLIKQTSFEFLVLDVRIKPWFKETSRVIGTVMMHNVSSGRTIADASTHESTSPAKTNPKGVRRKIFAHCTQKSWVTWVAALKIHGLHRSQHSKGTGQNYLIFIQLDTPLKLNLNGTRVAAFNYVSQVYDADIEDAIEIPLVFIGINIYRGFEESMSVYDTDIEDAIEKEEEFVRKGRFDGEEDNIKDVVVVANDLCSSMIQTSINSLLEIVGCGKKASLVSIEMLFVVELRVITLSCDELELGEYGRVNFSSVGELGLDYRRAVDEKHMSEPDFEIQVQELPSINFADTQHVAGCFFPPECRTTARLHCARAFVDNRTHERLGGTHRNTGNSYSMTQQEFKSWPSQTATANINIHKDYSDN
nr:hypothetical protein [Tanacetum cinerariifolium]